MSRRVGKFKIDLPNIEDRPEMVKQIMGELIVVRCEQMYDIDAFYYTALCDQFDVVELGEVIPEYECICEPQAVKFKRLK